MIASRALPLRNASHFIPTRSFASVSAAQYGRTAAYRRLSDLENLQSQSKLSTSLSQPRLPSTPFAPLLTPSSQTLLRSLHTSTARYQQAQQKEDVKDPPRPEGEEQQKTDEGQKTTEDGKKSEKDDKKNAPPPPPHGDKSPWQVFRDTFNAELKESKEWNESTKQLADSAHDFKESEAVRKARAAYDATAGVAGSKTAQAVKSTAQAVGKGAAWTWDTSVVQGVRAGVNATGRGIEKVSRPVRETKAFKDVTKALDDGSSSRYGGWVEKEERRKRKEERDMEEIRTGRRPPEKIEEDPKYVSTFSFWLRLC